MVQGIRLDNIEREFKSAFYDLRKHSNIHGSHLCIWFSVITLPSSVFLHSVIKKPAFESVHFLPSAIESDLSGPMTRSRVAGEPASTPRYRCNLQSIDADMPSHLPKLLGKQLSSAPFALSPEPVAVINKTVFLP